MTMTDRLAGINEGVAVKAPVLVATTANLTLSGLSTIDGVAVAAGDRVLVKNQNTASENGIYTASSGAWSRAYDCDSSRDVVQGTQVYVISGNVNGDVTYRLTTSAPVIGTSSLSWSTAINETGTGYTPAGTGAQATTVAAKLKQFVTLEDFTPSGTVPDGAAGTNFASYIQAAITHLNSNGGGKLYVTRPGTYRVNGAVGLNLNKSLPDMAANIEIDCVPGVIFAAQSGFNADGLFWFGDSTEARAYTLTLRNFRIDVSGGAGSAQALSTYCLKTVVLENVELYGGTDPDNANADTGWADTGSAYCLMKGGRVKGFQDAGIYPNGLNVAGFDASEGTSLILDGVLIERCNNAVTPKRELALLKMTGCTITECNAGVVPGEIYNNSIHTNSCRRMEIIGCDFRQVVSNLVRIRGSVCNALVQGCRFEDWGYDEGGNSITTTCYAIVIQGAQQARILGNTFRCNVKLANTIYQRAVFMDNIEQWAGLSGATPVWAAQGDHVFADNVYDTVVYAYTEANSSGGSVTYVPSKFINEYIDASTGISSGLNPLSYLSYTTPASTSPQTVVGIGAKNGATVTAVEYGNEVVHRTVLTLAATVVSVSDANAYGSVKIYDFPEGRIQILGCTGSIQWAVTSDRTTTINNSAGLAWSLGSAAASNTSLTSTMVDMLPSTSKTLSVAGSGLNTASTAALSTTGQIDGTATAVDAYLNCAFGTGTDIDGDGTLTATGTITITWINVGDY